VLIDLDNDKERTQREAVMHKKIMVVDDSNLIHQMYKMVLMRYRCTVVHAQNGQDAMEKLTKHPDVNLLLVDINMPVMNGLDFIKTIKETGKYEHIPIVIVSTEGREEDTRRGLALGARGYVKKPFQPSELHALMDAIYPTEKKKLSA
jgi:two-component system chemotaxis response regulator CheY